MLTDCSCGWCKVGELTSFSYGHLLDDQISSPKVPFSRIVKWSLLMVVLGWWTHRLDDRSIVHKTQTRASFSSLDWASAQGWMVITRCKNSSTRPCIMFIISWYPGIESLLYKSFHLPWQLPLLQLWKSEAHRLGTFHFLHCDPWECRLRESHYGAVVELVWGRKRAGSVSAARVVTFVSVSNWSWHCGDVEGSWQHEVISTTT